MMEITVKCQKTSKVIPPAEYLHKFVSKISGVVGFFQFFFAGMYLVSLMTSIEKDIPE